MGDFFGVKQKKMFHVEQFVCITYIGVYPNPINQTHFDTSNALKYIPITKQQQTNN